MFLATWRLFDLQAPPIDKYELNIVSKHLTADYPNDWTGRRLRSLEEPWYRTD